MTTLDTNAGISSVVACYGHSLMAGAGGTALATLLANMMPNRMFLSLAIGGQTTPQIAARQGGAAVYVTLSGNAFANTNAVSVTVSPQLLSTAADTTTRYLSGTVNGIRCILTRTAPAGVETYTLMPAFASTASVTAGSRFIVDDAVNNKSHIQVIWTARNDATGILLSSVLPQIDACLAYLDRPARALVIGNTHMKTEATGSTAFNQVMAFNEALEDAYGDFYISVAPPTAEEQVIIGYSPSPAAQAQIDAGRIPDEMYYDNTHFYTPFYMLIAYRIMLKFIKFGW